MALFKKKAIDERVNKKWSTKTCLLSQLEAVLLQEHLIEFWIRHGNAYFQIGSSSDYCDKNGFFDKAYYINLNTHLNLFKLLNGQSNDDGFLLSIEIKPLFDAKMFDGKTLVDIWSDCVIVGIDEMNPINYSAI